MKNKNARNFVLGLIAGSVALLVGAAFRIVANGLDWIGLFFYFQFA
jgi:hypothetical protein